MEKIFNTHASISGYEFQNISRKAFETGEKIKEIEWDIAALNEEVTIDPEEMENTAVGDLRSEYHEKDCRTFKKVNNRTILATVLLCGAACTVSYFLLTPFFALFCIILPVAIVLLIGDIALSILNLEIKCVFLSGYISFLMYAADEIISRAIVIACLSIVLDLFAFLLPFHFLKTWKKRNFGKYEKDPEYQRLLQEAEQADKEALDKELQARKEALEQEKKQKLPTLKNELAALRAEFAYYKPVLDLWEERMDELRRYECPLIPDSKEDFFNQLVRETPSGTNLPLILSFDAKDKFKKKKEECQKDINDCMGLLDDIFNMVKEDPSRLNKLR